MAGAKPGRAKKPKLKVVKEGNPGHRPVADELRLPPKVPPEPDWVSVFPAARSGPHRAENIRDRAVARTRWRLWTQILDAQGLVASVDELVLQDAAVAAARLEQCERDISLRGIWVEGYRGTPVKNPCVTAAAQLRLALKSYIAHLGLSPVARTHIPPREGGPDDPTDPFD